MACCSLRCVMSVGILLAILDMFHGLTSIGFYVYMYILQLYSQCTSNTNLYTCVNNMYVYAQMFHLRTYMGLGEGIAGLIFPPIYIVALVKRLPTLTWLWLLKALAVIGINIYWQGFWPIMMTNYDQINYEKSPYEDEILYAGQGLTLIEIVLLIVYCFVGAIFSYKVCKKPSSSRRMLINKRKWDANDASAPPIDYDEEGAQYVNKALANGEKSLPLKASRGSLSDPSEPSTFKHSSGV